MTTQAKLTDTQTTILKAAAGRPNGNIEPLPATLRGGARTKVIEGLLAKGLVAGANGHHLLTDAGYAAVGKRRPAPKAVQKIDAPDALTKREATHALQKLEATSPTRGHQKHHQRSLKKSTSPRICGLFYYPPSQRSLIKPNHIQHLCWYICWHQATADQKTTDRYQQAISNMLTDKEILSLKGREKTYRIADGGGLYLEVKPDGAKYWRLAYRFGGKQKTLALGVYPTVGAKTARKKREEAKKLLENNIDPSLQRKVDKWLFVVFIRWTSGLLKQAPGHWHRGTMAYPGC